MYLYMTLCRSISTIVLYIVLYSRSSPNELHRSSDSIPMTDLRAAAKKWVRRVDQEPILNFSSPHDLHQFAQLLDEGGRDGGDRLCSRVKDTTKVKPTRFL